MYKLVTSIKHVIHTRTRTQLYLGAGLNLIGSIFRYLSTIHPIVCSTVFDKAGFTVAMIGQFLTACAQPFMLYAPTKLASFWFGPKERAICTNFASIGTCMYIHLHCMKQCCVLLLYYIYTRYIHATYNTANPIGLAIAQLASPYIVTSADKLPMMVSTHHRSPTIIINISTSTPHSCGYIQYLLEWQLF